MALPTHLGCCFLPHPHPRAASYQALSTLSTSWQWPKGTGTRLLGPSPTHQRSSLVEAPPLGPVPSAPQSRPTGSSGLFSLKGLEGSQQLSGETMLEGLWERARACNRLCSCPCSSLACPPA